MGVVLDVGSELDGEVNSKPQSYWTERQSTPKTQCNRSGTRRKRKPMTSPQSGFSRRCNSCGVTKTPQWREGPDGPRTLCNACGVRYSRERQDKTKLRKCKKARSKPTGSNSTKKRPRALDPSQYDIAFLFSQKRTLTTPKCNKRSPVEDGFSGKEYAAALSLVSLAILGSTDRVSSSKIGPMKLDGSSRGMETEDLEVDHCCRTQTTSSLSPVLGSCRRSQRIMEAKRTPSHYYGGFNIEEWVPNFVDLEEGSGCEGTGHSCMEDGVAVGVPCVWAAMSSLQDFCHHPSKKTTPPRAAHQDQSFLLQNPCPSSASSSAKSDVYTQQVKSNDHH